MLRTDLAEALAGTFTGTDQIHASQWADAETAQVEASGEWELGGGLLVQRWRDTRAADTFELVNAFMEDPATGEVLLYAFDSVGYPADPPARGRWEGGSLRLVRQTERGQSRTDFTPTADGFRWRKQYRPSAEHPWVRVVDGELVRVEQPGGGPSLRT